MSRHPVGSDRERYESVEFLQRVRDSFARIRSSFSSAVPWQEIDATQPVQSIHSQILSITSSVISSVAYSPIKLFS